MNFYHGFCSYSEALKAGDREGLNPTAWRDGALPSSLGQLASMAPP